MPPTYDVFFKDALARRDQEGRRRRLAADYASDALRFDSNDYFSLKLYPTVIQAAANAAQAHGAGAGASRLAGGDYPGMAALENKLAARYGFEACLLAGSGYLANIGALQALAGKGDLILADKLSHACMLDGARLSGADILRFRHNDASHCREMLAKRRASYSKCLIMTETIFSMDGDAAPLDALARAAKEHDALLYADHAHGIGFMRPNAADIVVGTLSKALASYGGYILCNGAAKDYFINHMRSVIFSTALPPSCVAAASEALDLLQEERIGRTRRSAALFASALGMPAPAGAVIPVILHTEAAAMAASQELARQGINAAAIRPPAVPPNASRLRFAFNASHSDDDVARAVSAIKNL